MRGCVDIIKANGKIVKLILRCVHEYGHAGTYAHVHTCQNSSTNPHMLTRMHQAVNHIRLLDTTPMYRNTVWCHIEMGILVIYGAQITIVSNETSSMIKSYLAASHVFR